MARYSPGNIGAVRNNPFNKIEGIEQHIAHDSRHGQAELLRTVTQFFIQFLGDTSLQHTVFCLSTFTLFFFCHSSLR